jgi:hypothetical protein
LGWGAKGGVFDFRWRQIPLTRNIPTLALHICPFLADTGKSYPPAPLPFLRVRLAAPIYNDLMPEPGNGDRNFWITVARYSQLAMALPAATVAGWLIGYLLDRWLHTSWLYLAGLLFGIAAGFIELIRTVTRSEQ